VTTRRHFFSALGSGLGLGLLLLAGAAQAQAQATVRPEQLVKWRQSAYQVLAWNSGRIKLSLDATYNRDEVLRSAQVIAALANANLHSLFPPGTEKTKGWHDTAARPELFTEPRVATLAADFTRDANLLAQAAAAAASGGDVGSIRTAFGNLTRSCKACHDAYKGRD